MRVHELAKKLKLTSKDILALCSRLGIEAKSHMSTLDESDVARLQTEAAKPAPPSPPAPLKPEPVAKPTPPHAPDKKVSAKPVAKKEEISKPKPEPTPAPEEKLSTKKEPAPETETLPKQKPAPKQEEKKPTQKPPEKQEITPPLQEKPETPTPPADGVLRLRGPCTVRELAEKIGEKPNRIVAELMSLNIFASINQKLDLVAVKKIAEKYGLTVEQEKKVAEYTHTRKTDEEMDEEIDRPEDLLPRPPVVTFLGHVDHGKTSLLDRIRNASVAASEHGGITQHMGAYSVEVAGRSITFLDTPGHEAFTAMRARGANLTDIAVIIVASDDGVMPQTKEAIKHAKAAGVSIMIAINKMDLPTANPDRIKKQLQAEDLAPEDWGGETICVPVSAATGQGINQLLEMILLQADMLELRANPRRRSVGFVVEAKLEPGMGPASTVLVTNGTLAVGDVILCGRFWGRVKALVNDRGIKVRSVKPGGAVKCMGLSGVPEAGAEFRGMVSDRIARKQAEEAALKHRDEQISSPKRVSLTDLYDHLKEGEKAELRVVVKADSQGSVEAINHSLQSIKSSKVTLDIILNSTGNINTSDVMLASASNAVVLGFNVAKEPGVDPIAKHEGVEIRLHQVIYDLIDEIELAMMGLLKPILNEKFIGNAQVLQVFSLGKSGTVAGCRVTKGFISSKCKIRVKRNGEELYQGGVESLKHFQNHVSEVKDGQECGLRVGNFKDFEVGDILEAYEIEEISQSL